MSTERVDQLAYLALAGRILRADSAAQLEALVPDLVVFAGGARRHELAQTWLKAWRHTCPDHEPDWSLWPPE